MYCTHLAAANFRNYVRLDLHLPRGVAIVVGDNAQGKSNLLEALYLLATTRSFRAGADRELVNFGALEGDLPFSRVSASVQRQAGEVHVEAIISQSPGSGQPELAGAPMMMTKKLRVNGVPRRAVDYIGAINVVMFSPRDIELVDGPPSGRRRYLDVTICQVEPRYVRALSRYNKVLLQRNHLLRQIREGRARVESLAPWDHELVATGAYVVQQRQETLTAIAGFAREYYRQLTGRQEVLAIDYRSSVSLEPAGPGAAPDIAESYRQQLRAAQRRDVAAGACCLGPHRDDLAFIALERDMALYGSRGQQRTVTLALKLAEAAFLRQRTGEQPILLLDDVLSELDEHRRRFVLGSIEPDQQVILTATDLDAFAPEFVAEATGYRVEAGIISRLSAPAAPARIAEASA